MPLENEPPKPQQSHDNHEETTSPQRRAAEDFGRKERQDMMEYTEKNEEKLLNQLEKLIIAGEKDEYFPYIPEIADFIDQHRIKNPPPLFRKLLERLTPEQALVLSHGINGSQDKEYSSKFREKLKTAVNPEAILRHSSYTLPSYFSKEEIEKMVKMAIFILQTSNPNADQVIYKYLYSIGKVIPEAELVTLAKETLEKIINSDKPETILQYFNDSQFEITIYMDNLILRYTEKAVAKLASQGRKEEIFNYARNYQNSFMFQRMIKMRQIFGPIIIDVLKNPSEKIYQDLLSAPDYYFDLSFMDRNKFENALYSTALRAAQDRDLMQLFFKQSNILYEFLGDKMQNIWDQCRETDPELFEELDMRR